MRVRNALLDLLLYSCPNPSQTRGYRSFMAVSVDVGTLVIAVFGLLVTFNPQVVRLIRWTHLKVRSWLTPGDLVCESFSWQNFNGLIHSHQFSNNPSQCTLCLALFAHTESKSCWTQTLELAFNSIWVSPGSRIYVRKPAQLPLSETFLRVDGRMVLAYFFVTARIHEFKQEMLSSSLQYIDLSASDGIIVAHLGRASKLIELTKDEIEHILEGWPPFYRQTFETNEGYRLPSPIQTFDDVRRPAWIVAIGLGRVQPTDLFVDNSKDEGNGLFNFALQRVQHVLDVEFEKVWPRSQELDRVRRAVKNMRKYGRSIEQEWLDLEDRGPRTVAYPERHNIVPLSQEQCEALLRVFQRMSVSAIDRSIIDPALETCLHRVAVGVVVALGYRPERRIVDIPHELQGDRTVYLRGCERRR